MNNQVQTSQGTRPAGRPRKPNRDEIVRDLLEGLSPKEIAYKFKRQISGIHKIALNAGIRKEYVTQTEFRNLLNHRKSGGTT
jgi:DNA-binding NarL/FixJ family response regulator